MVKILNSASIEIVTNIIARMQSYQVVSIDRFKNVLSSSLPDLEYDEDILQTAYYLYVEKCLHGQDIRKNNGISF